jgi:hypothetical protein
MCLNNLVTHSKNQTIVDTSRTAKDDDDAEDRMILILAIVISVFIVALAVCILYRALSVRKQPCDEGDMIPCAQIDSRSPYDFDGSVPLMPKVPPVHSQQGFSSGYQQAYAFPMY